jgi:AAA family ATP:ADP antiporter
MCAHRLEASAPQRSDSAPAPPQTPIGGSALAGFKLLLRSPYLAGIALWVLLLSLCGTFLYFQQASIVAAASDDPALRTRIFASIDLAAGLLTVLIQATATGRVMTRFGVGPAAALLPLVFAAGFAVLAASPVLLAVIAFQAVQRTANFAVSNPAREVLFTVVEREEKYKSKYLIDGVVFRGGDALFGWLFNLVRAAGVELATISVATVPVAMGWFLLALSLGRAQEGRAARSPSASSWR